MFERTLKLIDKETFKKMQSVNILIVGIGGVGGFALESLIRLGFQNITIIDNDVIDQTNLNRQIITNQNNIGFSKVDVAKERCLAINPNANITVENTFIDASNVNRVVTNYDYIIDACDTITTKVLLIKKAIEANIKIISSMGTGNRFNPSLVKITTLKKTYNDPLAKKMRELLRKENIKLNIPVVWSSEIPQKIKERSPGSIILVPAAAGLNLAYYILEDLKGQ